MHYYKLYTNMWRSLQRDIRYLIDISILKFDIQGFYIYIMRSIQADQDKIRWLIQSIRNYRSPNFATDIQVLFIL